MGHPPTGLNPAQGSSADTTRSVCPSPVTRFSEDRFPTGFFAGQPGHGWRSGHGGEGAVRSSVRSLSWLASTVTPVDSLADITARLTAGSSGRTEADIQSDVRKFLLDAPLDIQDADVLDVALEAQAGGGKRIDVEAGCAAIEVKKNLSSPQVLDAAREQLAEYVRARTTERGQSYVGVLTDGRKWILYHAIFDGSLEEVSSLEIAGGDDAARLASWLEIVLATTEKIAPIPKEIVRRLGAQSPSTQLALADLRSLYASCRKDPEVQLKRELWGRLLVAALGQNFEDTDDLFVVHTYLVLTAELLAHEVMGLSIDVAEGDIRALLEGRSFEMAGLHGVVEADFFDWPAVVPAGTPMIRSIARRLSRFDWDQVDHDVLKVLYESVIDTETRHQLGEYYTPDWLADKMVSEAVTDPLNQRVLDPACGSGTFLFWAVRRYLAASDEAGVENAEALRQVVDHVHGIDLHPVAVTLARVTYLLALTPARLRDRGELSIPVYLGDSVRWEQDETLLSQGGITIHTSDGAELFAQELHFPEGVVQHPPRFDRLVADLAARASERKIGTKPPDIGGLLNRHKVTGERDREAVTTVFQKLCRLHDDGRDHIWAYYVRNLARPLAFTRSDRQVDVLVGNPPWLAYRHMPERLQMSFRSLAESRGLWSGGKVATNQDLSDLFVARSVEQYLRPGGRFAFVMPFAVLSRRQYAGFRTGEWSPRSGEQVHAAFDQASDFSKVKPSLFPVPSCVVAGTKAAEPVALSPEAVGWAGKLPSGVLDWEAAKANLTASASGIAEATDRHASPYRSSFTQGATLVPRVLVMVERAAVGPLGEAAGRVRVSSARSSLEKPPWKSLPTQVGAVEERFVHAMYGGSSVVPFRALSPALAVVPWDGDRLLDGTTAELDEFPGLAAWWRNAERLWLQNRSGASKLTLRDQLDFRGKLHKQFPIPQHRVVYSASGNRIAACRVSDMSAIVEHKLYWAAVASEDEGRYLCAVLNSTPVAEAVAPLQSVGDFGARDFDLYVFALPLPAFEANSDRHRHIADLGARAEEVARRVHLEPNWGFQKARRVTRDALRNEGVATAIDAAVTELLEASDEPAAARP